MQSYEFFAEAEEQTMPSYRVEPAKSGRSACKVGEAAAACKHDNPAIEKGELRWGSYDAEAGSYSRWHHMRCWRIPSAIWLGLPPAGEGPDAFEAALLAMEHIALVGFSELSAEQRAEVVAYFLDAGAFSIILLRR